MDRPGEAGAHEQSHGADIFTYLPEQIGMSVAAISEKAPGANESSTSVQRRLHRKPSDTSKHLGEMAKQITGEILRLAAKNCQGGYR
jgi:hypothetical protein